ncbi:hypothetical protein JTE90_007663 [Oedothorax gibbosus]|uniref:Uncharacterized protein n=1 Tax=Oedothorax gibbosus TaxID=931172 RepID=A0AAV6TRW8_9ARAC|nr:hypothetical protein JTE90_007663 [Oedothorax gibbosus]
MDSNDIHFNVCRYDVKYQIFSYQIFFQFWNPEREVLSASSISSDEAENNSDEIPELHILPITGTNSPLNENAMDSNDFSHFFTFEFY